MNRKHIIVIVLLLFMCGKSYSSSCDSIHWDSTFYDLVLWDFHFNGHYVPLTIRIDNKVYYALHSNDGLARYIQPKMNMNEDRKLYVAYMKQILKNQEILEITNDDFIKYGFSMVTIDSNLVKEVEKNRMKFIRKYFDYEHYFYYLPDYFTNSDSIIYKQEVKNYYITQDIPYEKQLCIIYLLLERNVAINTIGGYDGWINYIGPYKNSPSWKINQICIKGKRAIRLSRKISD